MWASKPVQENDGRDCRKQGLFIFFFKLSLQAQHITALTDRCALFSCVESVTVE
jgi:hypothetical protein